MRIFGKSNPSFIGIYDNVLTQKDCDLIISNFEKDPKIDVGCVAGGYYPERKQCLQLMGDLGDNSIGSRILFPVLCECVDKYHKEYPSLSDTDKWGICGHYNIQKYETEYDGFKVWHFESGSNSPSNKRVMAWMFYLNNAKSGTDFMYYPSIKAKRGRCVIWPAGFTHCHKGTPNKGLKYIATGWVSYFE